MDDHNDNQLLMTSASETTPRDVSTRRRSLERGVEFRFNSISMKIKDRTILNDVSGSAFPGQMVAIMGPSGSGKTSLLNILAGRANAASSDGYVTLNGDVINKTLRRRISYVTQEDIFFPNLTVEQTLKFAAELRLKESFDVKMQIVDDIINALDLRKCATTIIGGNLIRGISGGEKKRVSIANELLTDPSVLLLDEPTSGLDSNTAFDLICSLKKYVSQFHKTLILTIHQPSAQVFFKFDTLILLQEGHIAYYGSPNDVIDDFAEMGFVNESRHYNPADFILEIVSSDVEEKLLNHSNARRINQRNCPITCQSKDEPQIVIQKEANNGDVMTSSSMSSQTTKVERKKWPTSFLAQVSVLTRRSFIQGRGRYLSRLNIIKTFGIAFICGLIWLSTGRGKVPESRIMDICAALFYLAVHYAFNSLFEVLIVFPAEREVVNKERMGGMYRLSAYYIAKCLSELPLALILPSTSFILFYVMAGLNGMAVVTSFFGSWLVIVLITITSQSLGIFVSTVTMDWEHGMTLAVMMMIFFMLLGGFYVKAIPDWLVWSRVLSPLLHAYSLLVLLEFNSDDRVICNATLSSYAACDVTGDVTNETRFIPAEEIVAKNGAPDITATFSVLMLFCLMIVFRIFGYIFLRYLHKPVVK